MNIPDLISHEVAGRLHERYLYGFKIDLDRKWSQQAKLKTENIIRQRNLNSNVILFLQTWSFQKLFSKSTKTFPYLSYSASRAFQAGKRDILSILNEINKSRRKNFPWENVLKSRFMEFLDKAEIVCWKVLARTSNRRQCSLSSTQLHTLFIKYTNTQIHKYTNTQIHKYTNTQCTM